MKVMTNQMEARGLQSRTEVRQTVAQMAAPNFKDSAPEDSPGQVMIFPRANSYFAPGKLGLCSVQTRTLLRAKSRFASGKFLARRAAMLLILMIGMISSAWGDDLTAAMFHSWSGTEPGSTDNGSTTCAFIFDKGSQSAGTTLYGDGNVGYLNYADLSNYSRMMVSFEGSVPRFLFNRVSDEGTLLTEVNSAGTYATVTGNLITIDLKKLASENGGYAHLNAIKVNWGQTSNIKAVNLDPFYPSSEAACQTHVIYQKYYDNEWQRIFPVDMGSLKDKILSCLGKTGISEITKIYLRWYIADLTTNSPIRDGSTGMPISMKDPVLKSVDGHYQENDGMLWFHNDGTPAFSSDADFSNAFNVSVDLYTNNIPFFQNSLQMVCVVTEDLTGIAPQHEPANLQHKFIIRFLSDAGLAAIDFPVTSEAPAKVYGKIVSGISDSDNAYNLQSVLTELYNQAKGADEALNGKTPKYARFYLTTSSGVIKDASSFFTAGGGNALSNYQNKGSKGLVWSNDAWPGDFNISNLVATKSASDSWGDLRIVCDLTDDMSGSYKVGDLLMEEPTHLTARLIVGFTGTEPEPTGFEGKLSKDAFTHTREIMMTTADVANGYVVVPLAESFETILSEYNTTAEGLDNNLHLRWCVTCDGVEVANSETLLAPVTTGKGHLTKAGEGIYWNSATSGLTSPWTGNPTSTSDAVKDILNVKFSKTDASKRWDEYKVVVVMSNDATEFNGQIVSGGELVQEPRRLNMMFTYTIYREDEFLFVHHKGASDRDYLTSGDDSNISTTYPAKQYSWNNPKSSIDAWPSSDIRQGVHTVEYDVYLKTTDGAKNLLLPFEAYTEGGNNLEPMAYIRWYDWATDLGSSHLNKVGTWLENKTDASGSRGLFMLNNSWTAQHPVHSKIGVNYDPSSLTDAGDIIACDASKYYDGIYTGVSPDSRSDFSSQGFTMPVLIHEPTLSTRYLFHVYPSTVIASKIKTGDDRLTDALTSLNDGSKNYSEVRNSMFNLCEDNGRVIVSLNGSAGDFALRAQLQSLEYYFLEGGNLQCSQIEWYAYLEDEKGLWLNATPLTVKEQKGRVYKFDLSYLNGTYSLQSNTTDSKSVTAAPGMRFHIVGKVGGRDGSYTLHAANAIHYELQFVNAPAYLAEELLTRDVKRTDEYLRLHLDPAGTVNFDNYFPDMSEPTKEDDNYRFEPLPWNQAQYGFCYPSIDKYRIGTAYSGMSPIHGDYMLLKSIKKPGVSAGTGYTNMTNNIPDPGYQHVYLWYNWDAPELDDYTHTVLNNSQYGGFFYVDASHESRTIATLDFSANLCSGSQIYFTAAVADATSGGKTSPQLMAHVYAYEKDGSGNRTGEKKLVISFLTCVLNTVTKDDGGYKYHKWYQVYGYGTIPESIDITNYDEFTVEIDNYSKDTEGADFCVDQISFYTSTAQVSILQNDVDCNVDKITMSIFMDGESLKTALGASDEKKNVYWSICDESGMPLENIYNVGKSTQIAEGYGKIELTPNYTLNADGSISAASAEEGFYKEDGNVYFRLINDQLPLEEGTRYYVSIYSLNNIPSGPSPTDIGWGAPTKGCTVCSSYFVAQKMHLSFTDYGGAVTGTVVGSCGGGPANVTTGIDLNRPDSSQPSGFQSFTGIHFDFFKGSKDELVALLQEVSASYGVDNLVTALQNFRTWDKTQHGNNTDYQTNSSGLTCDITTFKSSNAADGAIIEKVADLLILSASTSFSDQMSATTEKTFNYMAFPLEATVQISATESKAICSPLSFSFNYEPAAAGPTVTLGFDDVDYSSAGTKRVLRVGLEQLNKMRTQGYKLHIPVNSYSDKNQVMTNKLYFPTDAYLTISAVDKSATTLVPNTTDPTKPAIGTRFAKIVPNNSSDTRPSVDKDHMYISLDLSGENCAINFHEGYEYEVATTFVDESDEGSSEACIGDLFLVIKVVPEFVTWHAQPVGADGKTSATETGYWSANWYNDDNWKRSTRAELYKGAKGSDQNTATAGHPVGYENNGEGTLNALTEGSNPGFVPMKFTYVTLPGGNHAPSLINEPRVVGEGVGSRRQGGGFLDLNQTKLLTDRSPRDPDGTANENRTNSKPTDNIYYDMLVRYSYSETDKFGEGCFGHRYIKGDGSWADQGTENLSAKVFDVEKFQGNICNEIYFKPGAELLRQQRLTYKRAWVETEMYANKWYLLASPLQCTYAGDMYVPASMTDVTSGQDVKGRQVTEAFQPITFNQTKGYSRTRYPIYQRSWGMNHGNVYVKENDIRANKYSANLNYSTVTTNLIEWGHTFNDVQVPYHTTEKTLSNNLAGFSIRAHKKDQTNKALIRLPKADTSYEYYDWTDTNSDPAAGTGVKAVSKPDYEYKLDDGSGNNEVTLFTVPSAYRLVTDEHQRDGDLEYSVSAMQQNSDYILVGNPYMVSIDMNKFFATNTTLDQTGYWTYEVTEENNVVSGEMKAYAKPTQTNTNLIKPMQAFFVKKGTAQKITFNRDMQVDGNFPPPASGTSGTRAAEAAALTLRTVSEEGCSSAQVEMREKTSEGYASGEDVETLFDSNLADVPMVYTVADNKAVSIDVRPSLDVVPFGVACANSDELVSMECDFSPLASCLSSLYMLDAVTGEVTEMYDGKTVSVQPNDYGRYFLTTRGGLTAIQEAKGGNGIVVSVRNKTLTVRSDAGLKAVRIVTVGGETVASAADCGTEASFALANSGVYIVEAQTASGGKTMKAVVR